VSGVLPTVLLIWVIVRTILLPIAGYFLGQVGGSVALRLVLSQNGNDGKIEQRGLGWRRNAAQVSKKEQLEHLSVGRAREEAKDLVPNDLPLQSKGASRFYLTLLGLFVLFYPVIDPILFGSGTKGRITSYGDLGYYVILALGLNIVVGFAGLLDLGYVAFFVIGTYSWALLASTQFTLVTGIVTNPQFISWLFWPMIIVAALIAAAWGVLLGAPTLRLRGDYLAIVTLGFGEIIPAFFLNLDKYTGGINGISGIYRPATPCIQPFFCLDWSGFNPTPYYYLILALIGLCIFANVRLRDSRLGRAWVALREDEIAASSSGINLVNTKLFAFAAGAFFSGVAGIYHAAKLGTIAPTDFNSNDSFIFLAMVVIGGLGSIPGVIVGAVVVYAINLLILAQLDTIASDPTNFLHVFSQYIPNFTFSNIRNLLFGIILITIMIFRPEGLIPSARRRRELHRPPDAEAIEMGALDEPPGSAEFEAEVHVE
jgi:ABC-type branched-subunit amino acid transport system permease subunit